MKIYTEEQIIKIIERTKAYKNLSNNELFETLTPIELPSDEEIRKRGWEDADAEDDIAFFVGAKWMKEQILKQNK